MRILELTDSEASHVLMVLTHFVVRSSSRPELLVDRDELSEVASVKSRLFDLMVPSSQDLLRDAA